MGVEISREAEIPESIDDNFEAYRESWRTTNYLETIGNTLFPNTPTLSTSSLEYAGKILSEYISDKKIEMTFLEIMAGNGVASYLLKQSMCKHGTIICNWKATDLQNFTHHNPPIDVEFDIDSVETISKYGQLYNTLFLISPPPCLSDHIIGYGDYFAIKEWIKLSNAQYIIIIGELGASDGSPGMYKYMLNLEGWHVSLRHMIYQGVDIVGGPVEKEIFIFEKDQ